MFEKFAVNDEEDDEDEEAEKPAVKSDAPLERMEGGGIQKLFEEIELGMEGVSSAYLSSSLS